MSSFCKHSHVQHVGTAFLQLSFAIKVWHFLDEYRIGKEKFDCSLTIHDNHSSVCLSHNEFDTYNDIIFAAENNISICFGAASITLWEAIREYSGLSSDMMDPGRSRRENLAALSYMIRCCFAHGSAQPVWCIHKKYKTIYCVGNKTIDLTTIGPNQVFDYASIGGYETLWFLKDEARANGLFD